MQRASFLSYGFAIFAMFFGSGNLVFPLEIGLMAGPNWVMGFLGLLLTGIILPFLGLFVIKLHKGDYFSFFGSAGRLAQIILPLFTLSLLGSFGVVPRCITVAHGGLTKIFLDLPLSYFSIFFCLISFILCLKDGAMVAIIGKWMSPILIVSLSFLIIMGMVDAQEISGQTQALNAFSTGFVTGYQTMDLFAAFFFSALVFKQIKRSNSANLSDKQLLKLAIIPSVIGSLMLAMVYLGFVYLGSNYKNLIMNIEPELMLATIAIHLMGPSAMGIIVIAMVFSCLSTAVALNNIYARHLCHVLKLGDTKFPLVLAVTTLVAFVISLLDFKGISAFIAPVLEVSYPGLIALTLLNIFFPTRTRLQLLLFWGLNMIMIII